MLIADLDALAGYLAEVQNRRETDISCAFTAALSARLTDAAISEALVTGLPMVQGISHRIVRSRGRGLVLTAKLRYREGVQMLDQWPEIYLPEACDIVTEALRQGGEEARFRYVYNWVCRNIRYEHTAPGQKGYEQLVGATGVLRGKRANCQGFADLMYLLCGICGIKAEYRCGRGARRLHVWNAVKLNGEWQEVDASKGAREIAD